MCNIYMFNHLRNKQHVKKVHLNINLIGHVIKSCKLFENGNIVKSITSCFFVTVDMCNSLFCKYIFIVLIYLKIHVL